MSTKRPGKLRGIALAMIEGRAEPWRGPARAAHRPPATKSELAATNYQRM